MRDFAVYTALRLVLFVAAYGLLWLVLHEVLSPVPILLLAVVLSAIASIFVLSGFRDRLAGTIDDRAARVRRRLEQSRRAEDDD